MAQKQNPNVTRSHWRAPSGTEYRIVDSSPGEIYWLLPTAEDIACGIPEDPNNCAGAQYWKRANDVPDAQIGIDKCYLPMWRDGELVALRVKTSAPARRTLDHFDETSKFPPDGLKLIGVSKSERIDSQRSQAKRDRERWDDLKNTKKPRKKYRKLHLRNASRRAQVVKTS